MERLMLQNIPICCTLLLMLIMRIFASLAKDPNNPLPPGGGGLGWGGGCHFISTLRLHPPPSPLPSREGEAVCKVFIAICALFLACLTAPAAAAESDGRLSLKLDKARLYLGESTTATVTLHTGASAVLRNMRYPVLTAPAVSVGDFAPPLQTESLPDGVATTAYIFTAKVTPHKTGALRLGPARLTGEVSRPAEGAGGFFGETSQQEVSFYSEALDLTVLPLPAKGRPSGFSGAVGRFSMKVGAAPVRLQPGDPLTLTSIISGNGNLAKAVCPDAAASGFRSYPPTAGFNGASLQCSQVIIPETAGAVSLPPLRFSFFNTSTAAYETLQSRDLPLIVTARISRQPVVSSATSRPSPKTAAPERPASGPLYRASFLLAAVIALVIMLLRGRAGQGRGAFHSGSGSDVRRKELVSYVDAADAALSNSDAELFYDSVFRALELARREENHVCDDLIAICDAVRYGRRQTGQPEMEALLMRVKQLLERS